MSMKIRPYLTRDEKPVIELWNKCDLLRPWNNPAEDIKRKLAESPDMFVVGEVNAEVVSTCMFGYDGHRGWVYYLAVDPRFQRKRIATEMMKYAEEKLKNLGCPKINLMVRESNKGVQSFYYGIGYNDDPVVVLSKRLYEDEPHEKNRV